MADDKQSGPGLGGNSVVLLLAAAASAVYMGWRSPPLFSTRPTEPDYEISQTKSTQDIDARLWQDPFAAVQRGLEDKRNGTLDREEGHCLSDFRKHLKEKEASKGKGPSAPSERTLLVGVDLPGDPYPEAVETRRRLRYAVLSALHVAKYVPVDERHIGYFWTSEDPAPRPAPKPEAVVSGLFRIATTSGGDPSAEGTFNVTKKGAPKCGEVSDNGKLLDAPAVVPFEQYEDMSKNRVIILWLDEGALGHRQNPIASLAGLLCKLDLAGDNNESFVLLGPQDSDVLQRMVSEISHYKDQEIKDHENHQPLKASCNDRAQKPLAEDLLVYNYGATAADDQLIRQPTDIKETQIRNAPQTEIRDIFHDGGIRYYRTISSDRELAEVLAQELRRRGIDLCPKQIPRDPVPPPGSPCLRPHHDRVFLLSEWDTAYGRYLPQSVAEIFGADDSSFGGCRLNTLHGIMHAGYLRGLDGRLPSRRPAKGAQPSGGQYGGQISSGSREQTDGGEPSATPETASRFESAEGQSQFDYLRRLTDALKECDKKLRFENAGKIAAIGVLGSDVYDKLLLLQALRPEFPEATFFTTDLDELLLPQEKLRYTRNLLAASGHGLMLTPDLQKDILPFRSSYQTSIFLATRLALRNSNLPAPNTVPRSDPWPDVTAALDCWSKQPLLFQIGRTVARGLPTGSVGDADEACRARKGRETADFVTRASIDPDVEKLYPEAKLGARFGVFLFLIALCCAPLSAPGVRRICFTRNAPTEASGHSEAANYSGASGQTKIRPGNAWVIPLLAVALAVWALMTFGWSLFVADWLADYPDGDPMTLFEGISIWPTIALRSFGSVLALLLIWYTLRSLEINKYETAAEMGINKPDYWTVDDMTDGGVKPKSVRWWKIISQLWFPPMGAYKTKAQDSYGRRIVWFGQLSTEFSNRPGARCIRAGLYTGAMVLVWQFILVPVFGDPQVAARGTLARDIYWWVTLLDVIPTLFLAFLVADATLWSRTFIARLTKINTEWPDQTFDKFRERYGLPRSDLADWIDLQYLAKRTQSITQLIYFPFLSLTVLFLSRSHLFDDFSTPWTLPVSQAISVAIIIASVLAYRSAAENARKVARNHLTAKIVAAQGNVKRAAQLQLLLSEIDSLREGAFAPLTSQPIVKAVLLPLVTYGGAWLAHIYGLPGT